MISVKKLSKLFIICATILTTVAGTVYGQNLTSKSVKVRFFSSTPLEDIKAVSEKGIAVLVTKTAALAFQVPIKSFEFDKGLMQEHFNENYMESEKYPFAKFNGKIDQAVDFSKDGVYKISATGTLLVHGVPRQRTIIGTLKISDGTIQISSAFDIACVDHKIKIPTLVITKIAEVIKVNVDATLKP